MLKPLATATREPVRLDGLWRFAVDTAVGDAPWDAVLDSALEAPVPASYNDLFTDEAIRDHVGWVWYQRQVRVPRGWDGSRVLLRLDSATHEGVVYVDGTRVTGHVGGYLPFEVDVTDHVTPGEEFRLTVGVNNELTNTTIPPGTITVGHDGRRRQTYLHDFFNYAGLHRSVWLVAVPEVRVTDVTVRTDVAGTAGIVDWAVDLSDPAADVRVRVLDAAGAQVATGAGAAGRLEVADVHLWQPGAAYLYELEVEVRVEGVTVDVYPQTFGVRTVEVRGEQFLINGEPFYFTGFGKHEDTPVRGKGHDDAYLVHDFQLLEWIGANSFRTSHYPYAEEVLDFADRHGIVVIDETAAVGLNLAVAGGLTGAKTTAPTYSPETISDDTRQAHAEHIRELIARDKNHPSVVMWCIANEPSSHEAGAREYFAPLVELTHELDPTRPVTYTAVMLSNADNDVIADLFDVICLNRYYGWYVFTGDLEMAERVTEADLQNWSQKFGKPLLMAEYGADTLPGAHSVWDMPWTEEYQRDYLAANHRAFDRVPGLVGEQVWNFADFQTSKGIHRVEGNRKGVFTRDRRPKAAAFALRDRWRGLGGRKPGTDAD